MHSPVCFSINRNRLIRLAVVHTFVAHVCTLGSDLRRPASSSSSPSASSFSLFLLTIFICSFSLMGFQSCLFLCRMRHHLLAGYFTYLLLLLIIKIIIVQCRTMVTTESGLKWIFIGTEIDTGRLRCASCLLSAVDGTCFCLSA